MGTLPQLIEEDIQRLDDALRELVKRSNATAALIVDQGGFLITHQGDDHQFDLTTIAALASGAYLANQTIANLVHESTFDSVYQQGDTHSMFVKKVDDYSLLIVIFKATVAVGIVKYYSMPICERIAHQMKLAHEREPGAGLDLSVLNVMDTSEVFKKKS